MAKKAVSVAELEKKIGILEKELEGKKEQHLRSVADYQNLQRRTQEDQKRFVAMATADTIRELLAPLDSLTMAAQHDQSETLKLILRQFWQVLEREGVKEIHAKGTKFDPQRMEAVESVEGELDVVIHVRQPGYEMNGYVLRPARVEVGNGSKPRTATKQVN